MLLTASFHPLGRACFAQALVKSMTFVKRVTKPRMEFVAKSHTSGRLGPRHILKSHNVDIMRKTATIIGVCIQSAQRLLQNIRIAVVGRRTMANKVIQAGGFRDKKFQWQAVAKRFMTVSP